MEGIAAPYKPPDLGGGGIPGMGIPDICGKKNIQVQKKLGNTKTEISI